MSHSPGALLGNNDQVTSAVRFTVFIPGWSTGLGFTKLSGFNSIVESSEYSYSGGPLFGMFGNSLTKQIGRGKAPSITVERGLDMVGFRQMLAWHMFARNNLPLAKVPAVFTIKDSAGGQDIVLELQNAWCSKLELDPVQAGATSITSMRVTIECDSITLL